MAIDSFDCVWERVACVFLQCCVRACVSVCAHVPFSSRRARYLHLHVWETEMKVTETKQTAFPLVASAAAVTFRPGRLGSRSSSA